MAVHLRLDAMCDLQWQLLSVTKPQLVEISHCLRSHDFQPQAANRGQQAGRGLQQSVRKHKS